MRSDNQSVGSSVTLDCRDQGCKRLLFFFFFFPFSAFIAATGMGFWMLAARFLISQSNYATVKTPSIPILPSCEVHNQVIARSGSRSACNQPV